VKEKLKFKELINISLLFFFISILSIIPISNAFPGDCRQHHTGQIISVPNDPNAHIKLDGIINETFWQENKEGQTQINVTTSDHEIFTSLNMSFVRNDKYIFISCVWPDRTTHPSTRDGFYICWNINVPNFTAYYPGGMDTSHMGGGYIDSWVWYINELSPINDSNGYCLDGSFGPNGHTDENDLLTIGIGYTTAFDSHYTLEISRKLTTSDKDFDVQFDRTKLYEFNLGIINNSAFSQDHSISYTHSLSMIFQSSSIDAYPIISLLLGISLISIIYVYKKKDIIKT
jgi:hypothetical protein